MALLSNLDSFLGEHGVLELVLVAGVSLSLAYTLVFAFYNIFFHPLAKYPGPRLAGLTRLWYCYYTLRGTLIYVLRDLHDQYGDVVRIAPDELSFTSAAAWNDIYGHRQGKEELTKDKVFYSSISSGAGSIISADRSRHGHLRKQMSHGFSDKALRSQEHAIRKYADLFIERLEDIAKAGKPTVDLVSWFNFFTFDVMGDLVFGQSFNCLQNSGYHPWVKLIFDSVKTGAFVRCSKYWPFLTPLVQWFIPADLRTRRMDQRQMAKEKAAYRKEIEDGREDLISGFLKPDSGISGIEYQSTVETLIIAGSETTATLMSGVTYYLLKDPDRMTRLKNEIRTMFTSLDEIDFVSVNKLPYLLACLNEALRMYPPVADAFPRNTGPNVELIAGNVVPPYSIVRSTHWAAYHLPSNFKQPDDFIPERWLEGDSGFESDKKDVLQPFSVGPRNCLGRNLAFVEMRLLMSMLLWRFDLELDARSDGWDRQKVFLLWEKPEMYVKLVPRP